MKWEGDQLVQIERFPCRTDGCKQVFEMTRGITADPPEVILAASDAARDVPYSCPRCGYAGTLWQLRTAIFLTITNVRPVVDAQTTRGLWEWIARLFRWWNEIRPTLEWVLDRVLVRGRALARKIKVTGTVESARS